MNVVIGDILPLAVGIAISPLPIIATILLLLSPRARGTSIGFLAGWVLGIVVAVVLFTLLAGLLPAEDPDASKPVAGVVKILLGLLLLYLAARQWAKRPRDGEEPALPRWLGALDAMTPVRGLLLAFVLAAVNPKNLLLAVSAGLTIGAAALPVGQATVGIVIFAVVAASTVLIPVVGYLVAANALHGPLDALRAWLVAHNATVMTVLLLVIGVVMIGKGIGSF